MNSHKKNVSILLHLLYYAPELGDLWAGNRLSPNFDRRLEQAIGLWELEPKAKQELGRHVADLLKELSDFSRSQFLKRVLQEARDGGGALPPRVSWMAWLGQTGVSPEVRLERLNELRVKGAAKGRGGAHRGTVRRGVDSPKARPKRLKRLWITEAAEEPLITSRSPVRRSVGLRNFRVNQASVLRLKVATNALGGITRSPVRRGEINSPKVRLKLRDRYKLKVIAKGLRSTPLSPVLRRGDVSEKVKVHDLSLNLPSASLSPPGDSHEPAERSINVWLKEASDRIASALSPGRASVLQFKVGSPVESSLVGGPGAEVPDSDVPEPGLETRWILSSTTLVLAAEPGDGGTTASATGSPVGYQAGFSLVIPKQGDSEVRRILITPQPRVQLAGLEVVVYVGAEVYRKLTVSLAVGGDGTQLIGQHETVCTPLRHAALRPSHEWTTPPGTLTIVVLGDRASVRGSLDEFQQVEDIVDWFGGDGVAAGRINNLRDAAEKLRMKHEAYLNAVDSADLLRRLGSFNPQYDWRALAFGSNADHDAAWSTVAASAELNKLAFSGYQLYNAFFPEGRGPLRGWLDSLAPGHRIDISWLRTGIPGWRAQVPWGLMYRQRPPALGTPIDPMDFWGLRFRIAHSSHPQQGTKALGELRDVPHAHLLYWGTDATTAAESQWQRAQWQGVGRPVLLPALPAGTGAGDPKAELLRCLDPPAGSATPLSLLYLYCNCTVDDGSDPILGFANTSASEIRLSELGQSPLLGQPLVFANACSTAAADPYYASALATSFIERGCRAFLGTETKVPIELASRFAVTFSQFFFRQVDTQPIAAGEAVSQARLFLWTQYRNLGGLLYSYVNRFELFMADDAEVAALRN